MPKIRYIKNEFRFGITEYKTPCPFGMRDRYALQVYEVASRMCKDCPHFVKDDQLIRMRLSAPYHSTVNKDALAVCKALQEIAGNYKISIHTRIINTAVKVIGIKIDNMNFNCD